jgi:hypothetical protein
MRILNRLVAPAVVFSLSLTLFGCVTVQKSPVLTVQQDFRSTVDTLSTWMQATYSPKWSLFQDGIIFRYVSEGEQQGRFELRWYAADLSSAPPFAVVRVRETSEGTTVLVEEERNDMPLTHKYQDVATKIKSVLDEAARNPSKSRTSRQSQRV